MGRKEIAELAAASTAGCCEQFGCDIHRQPKDSGEQEHADCHFNAGFDPDRQGCALSDGFGRADPYARVFDDPEMVFERFLGQDRERAAEQLKDVVLVLPTRPQDHEAGVGIKRVRSGVAEPSVEGDEDAVFLLASLRHVPVRSALELLVIDCLCVVSSILKELRGLAREVFIQLESHCG
jgi:hypothetical protein